MVHSEKTHQLELLDNTHVRIQLGHDTSGSDTPALRQSEL